KLTALGYHVGSLPVDVRIGKLMLYGVIFRCLDSTLTIAATLSFKSPFVYIRDCSLVSKLSLLIFGGGEISVEESFGDIIVKINKMIQFKMRNAEIALSLQALRSKLDQLLSDKISQPDLDLIRCSSSEKIINCIVDLLSDD
ncbi:ATP-dependent RNA helicase DHX57, partial [Biomphalaria glabrata]